MPAKKKEKQKLDKKLLRIANRLVRAFKLNKTIAESCEYAKISSGKYYRWRNSKPEFEVVRKYNKSVGQGIDQKKQKQTPETIGKLEYAFSIDCTIGEACFYAGIAESTFHEWCKEDKKLSERMHSLKYTPVLKARQTVNKNLKTVHVAQWYLEKKCNDEFSGKVINEHKITKIEVEIIKNDSRKNKRNSRT